MEFSAVVKPAMMAKRTKMNLHRVLAPIAKMLTVVLELHVPHVKTLTDIYAHVTLHIFPQKI